jgi:transcriptional regulator GlxA family with amidase domain
MLTSNDDHFQPATRLSFEATDAAPGPGRAVREEPRTFSADTTDAFDQLRHAIDLNRPQSAREAASRLLGLLTESAQARPIARGGLAPWQMRKADRYLRSNLDRSVRLDEVAALIPLSRSHFCRAFKVTAGESVGRYIIRLRVELAQGMMLSTRDPLSQIAIASGFADQAHLCKRFRRVVGETPNAWRRRNSLAGARPIQSSNNPSSAHGQASPLMA